MAEAKKNVNRSASRKLWTKIGIAAAAVAVVALVLVSYFTSTTYFRSKTALEIGEHDISAAEYNYYYGNAYQNVYASVQQTYGEYADAVLNPELPLDEQMYAEDQTWAEYLHELTVSNLEEIYAFYDKAVEAGYTLSEEGVAENEDLYEIIDANAAASGYSVDNYLQAVYGKGVNEKVYTKLVEIVSLSTEYSAEINDGFTFTKEERAAYYAEHKNDVDSVTARIYPIMFVTEDGTSTTATLTYDEAKAAAEEAKTAVTDEESFIDFVVSLQDEENKEAYADGASTLYSGLSYSYFANAEMSDWLFDEARAEGDTIVIEDAEAFYVAYFVSRSDNDYLLTNMRHILVTPEKDEEGNLVEGAMDAALEQAETLKAEWEANGATEDAFASLANAYSADGDGTTGGLYEDVFQGQMVDEIDAWLFDAARAEGDSEIIETTYGYHVMYFVGHGQNYQTKTIEDALRAEKYEAWRNEALEGHEAVLHQDGIDLVR